MANYSIPNSSPASGRISTGSLRRLRRQNRRPPVCRSVSGAWWLDVRKRRQVRHGESVLWRSAALQSALRAPKIRRWTFSARSFLQSGERRVPGGPRGLQNRRRHASGEVGSIPILSARFSLVILSGVQWSRRIPWTFQKVNHRDSSTSLGMTN